MPVPVEPFGSQNIWYNNKSASCKRHKKPSTLPPALLPLLSSSLYVVQLQFSDCHNIFYALLLLLLAFVLLWRGQSQMKFAVASLENFTTQPMPANQKPQNPPRCLHEQHTYCFLFSLLSPQHLSSPCRFASFFTQTMYGYFSIACQQQQQQQF